MSRPCQTRPNRQRTPCTPTIINLKDDESTCFGYPGLIEELEYLKIETRLIEEKFASVMGECVI